MVPYYEYALDMILDVEMPVGQTLTEEQQVRSVLFCSPQNLHAVNTLTRIGRSLLRGIPSASHLTPSDKDTFASAQTVHPSASQLLLTLNFFRGSPCFLPSPNAVPILNVGKQNKVGLCVEVHIVLLFFS